MKKIYTLILALIFVGGIVRSQVTVTGGVTLSYTTLGAAFSAINSGVHTGAITVDISASTTETASAVLNSSGTGGANYTSLLIFPSVDGVAVNGSTTTAAGRGVIELNGADFVTIDGDNPNTPGINRNLTIINNNTVTTNYTSGIRIATAAGTGFVDANNITIMNVIVNGSAVGLNIAGTTSTTGPQNTTFGIVTGPNGGAVIGSLSSVTTGMAAGMPANNLMISNNAINQCARGIAFLGNTTTPTTNSITITNNLIGANVALAGSWPYTSPVTTVYTKGIFLQGATGINISGNTIKNVMSYVATGITAMEFSTGTGAGGITIASNTITGISHNGVGSSTARAINLASTAATATYLVRSNIINNVQCNSATYPAGIYLNTTATSGIAENNQVSMVYNNQAGTSGVAGIDLSAGSNVTVRNNFIWDINEVMTGGGFSTTFGIYGIRVSAGTGHKILHNTVSLSGTPFGTGATLLSAALCIVNTSQTGMEVRNNVFSNTILSGAASNAHVCIYLPSTATSAMNLMLNNNAYYSGGTAAEQGIAQLGTTAGTNFYLASNFNASSTTPASNFRAFSSTLGNLTNDNSSFATTSAAPFISATNLHISNATYNPLESGAVVTTVTLDIDNDVRPGPIGSVNGGGTIPDIGADEFDGLVINTDLSAFGLASPVLPPSCYGPNQTVSVVIKNTGVSAIDFALNNATVTAFASGVNPQVFPNVVITSGTLVAGATQTVVMSTTYNMTTAGTYSFNGTATVAGDGNSSNDVMGVATRTVAPLVALPETVDFTGFTGANLTTVFPNWYEANGAAVPTPSATAWTSQTGLNAVGNITARVNLFSTIKDEWIVGPKFTAAANTQISFDAAVTNGASTTVGDIMGSDDMVRVMVSTNCGVSYTPIFTVSATNSLAVTFTNFVISLSAYAGQDIIVAFLAQDGPVDDIENYDFHLDNINIQNLAASDAGVSALVSPFTTGCYGSSENLVVTINNYGVTPITNIPVTVIVSGAATQTSNAVYTGTIAPASSVSFTVATLNMTASGTYSFNSFTSLPGDGNATNDNMATATRTNVAPVALPQQVNFTGFTGANLTTVFPNWYEATGAVVPAGTTSTFTYQTGLGGVGNITARVNLFGNTKNEWIVGPKFTAAANSAITFDAAVTNWNSITVADLMGSDDNVRVMVSTDCGVSYAPVFTVSATNSLSINLTNFSVPLGTYAGQDIIVAFLASEGTVNDAEDYDFHIDNINILNVPLQDAGITALTSPGTTGCYGASENLVVTINNFGSSPITNVPVTVIVSGAATQTLNAAYTGTIAPAASASFTVGTLNMTAFGTYSFNAFTSLPGDGNSANDNMATATRTNVAPVTLPQQVDFTGFTGANLTTVFPNWYEASGATIPVGTTSTFTYQTGLTAVGNITARVNLFGNTKNEWIVGPKLTASSNSQLTFDAAVTNWNSITVADLMGSDDMVRVMVSTDCGFSYAPVFTVSATNSLAITFTKFSVPLSVYAGQDIIVAFLASEGTVNDAEDYDFHLDNINICNLPSAPVSPAGSAICSGSTAAINASTVTGTPYWYNVSVGGSVISTSTVYTTPSLTANATYYLADSTGCGIGPRAGVTITVNPTPTITAVISPTAICSGGSATLTAGGANTYSMNAVSIPSVSVLTPSTSISFTLSGTDVNGCTASVFPGLNVNPNPTVTPVSTSSAVCAGSSATLTASGANTYSWTSVGTGSMIVVTPTANTTYTVEGIDVNGCMDVQMISVNTNSLPVMSANTSASVLCVGSSATLTASGANTYSWTGVGSGASIVVSPTTTVTYTVEGTDVNGCTDTISIQQVVSTCTGIQNIPANSNGVSVYPNPSNGLITLIVTDATKAMSFEIYDAVGKQVVLKEVTTNETQINLSELANGVYSFRLVSTNGFVSQGKLIKN